MAERRSRNATRKLERDLHDGAQLRLVSLAIQLRILTKRHGPEATPDIEVCIQNLLATLEELRDLARGLRAMKVASGRPRDLVDVAELDDLHGAT